MRTSDQGAEMSTLESTSTLLPLSCTSPSKVNANSWSMRSLSGCVVRLTRHCLPSQLHLPRERRPCSGMPLQTTAAEVDTTPGRASVTSKRSYDAQDVTLTIRDVNEAKGQEKLLAPLILSASEEKKLYRKIDLRLMPILTLMYLCSFLDRGLFSFLVRMVLILIMNSCRKHRYARLSM